MGRLGMSSTGNDRKDRSKIGKAFPDDSPLDERSFRAVVAAALRAEFGETTSAVKTIARLARTNERAARNWLDGKNGPSGENLVRLMRHSNVVLGPVLMAAERRDLAVTVQLGELRGHLLATLAAIDALQP